MEESNKIQRDLIEQSERPHFEGLRHAGLSGTICENALIKALKKSVPSLNFNRGMIKFCKKDLVGAGLKGGDLSTQIDIIIYKGEPLYRTVDDYVIVHISNVLGVVEVKKWSYPKMIEVIKNSLGEMKDKLISLGFPNIEMFFVSFRFHDRKKTPQSWFSQITSIPDFIHSYCFAGGFLAKGGINNYPWQETWWDDFDNYRYAGQYAKLIRNIERFSI